MVDYSGILPAFVAPLSIRTTLSSSLFLFGLIPTIIHGEASHIVHFIGQDSWIRQRGKEREKVCSNSRGRETGVRHAQTQLPSRLKRTIYLGGVEQQLNFQHGFPLQSVNPSEIVEITAKIRIKIKEYKHLKALEVLSPNIQTISKFSNITHIA